MKNYFVRLHGSSEITKQVSPDTHVVEFPIDHYCIISEYTISNSNGRPLCTGKFDEPINLCGGDTLRLSVKDALINLYNHPLTVHCLKKDQVSLLANTGKSFWIGSCPTKL